MHRYQYKWTLKDAKFTKDKGKVFSCFACGGGSTMGYKLAGFDVIGCNEIDKRMMQLYIANHNPRYSFLEPIQTFKERELPAELYNLDILDGSPPCSTFSMSGSREKAWGKKKKFREGQGKQVLDTLFFDFIDLAKRLQPKVVVAENVKGLLIGNAVKYVRKIYEEFSKAGYYCQHFLLDASKMGVPQRRERVFFLCLRKDLAASFLECVNLFEQKPKIDMDFNEPPILFGEFADYKGRRQYPFLLSLYEKRKADDKSYADIAERELGKCSYFSRTFVKEECVCPTITARGDLTLYSKPILMSDTEIIKASTFPIDYNFGTQEPAYVCGMSVPPVMMANIASRIYEQWISKF